MSAGPATAHRPTTHRPGLRRPVGPRGPRRVSGPPRDRARPLVHRATAPAPSVALPQPLVPRVLDVLRGLPDARWLDRLVRGRAWILVIGIALIGLVAMQVSMLGMNAGIGRSVERTATLERQNADLRATVSQLSSEERIQGEALKMGLVMPLAGEVRYVTARGGAADARRAARIMREPTPPAALEAATATATGTPAAAVDPTTPQAVTPAAAEAAQPEAQQPVVGAGEPAPQTPQPAATTAQTQTQAPAQTAPAQPQAQAAAPAEHQSQQQPVQPQAQATGAAAAPGSGG